MLSGISVAPVNAQNHPGTNGSDEAHPSVVVPANVSPMVVPHGVTNENVEVQGRPLIIEGDVKGSVHAVNSNVTLMPGATVEGNLTIEGGKLSAPMGSAALISAANRAPAAAAAPAIRKGNWFAGQFCLWLLGLAGGLIILVAAPHATSRVSETVSSRPGRSLVAGLITAVGMCSALAISGAIMSTRSIFSLIWTPALIVIAVSSIILLTLGWLAGMRRVGDMLAPRLGQTGSGTFYGRMALGLTAFFLFNGILGGLIPFLGAVGIVVEFAVALMGIGAIVQTGFGRDDHWLGRTFHRSSGIG